MRGGVEVGVCHFRVHIIYAQYYYILKRTHIFRTHDKWTSLRNEAFI
jgi:hypothetical protein